MEPRKKRRVPGFPLNEAEINRSVLATILGNLRKTLALRRFRCLEITSGVRATLQFRLLAVEQCRDIRHNYSI